MWFDKFFTLKQKLDELTFSFVLFFLSFLLSFFLYFFRFMISEFCCISLELFVVVMFLLNNCTLILYYYFFFLEQIQHLLIFSLVREDKHDVLLLPLLFLVMVVLFVFFARLPTKQVLICFLLLLAVFDHCISSDVSFKWFFFNLIKKRNRFLTFLTHFLQNFHKIFFKIIQKLRNVKSVAFSKNNKNEKREKHRAAFIRSFIPFDG